jgi:hypothetical protein
MRKQIRRTLTPAAGVFALLLLAGAFRPASAGALDLADGRIKVTLYDGIGRFSISCTTKGQNGIAVPLLAAQDPRTTTLSIVVGNKIYRMGESPGFSEKTEKVAGGGRFTWKSSFLQVTETFTFITSPGSPVTDGVRIEVGLKNLSERDASIGVRYLFDTYLGESSFVHFKTDTLTQLTRELTLTPSDKALYWVSPLNGNADNLGLQVMLAGAGITIPDRVEFANWKRLSDASWGYDTSASRNFSVLPYSVNDSAVSQYYDPRPVAKGAETTITLALGNFNPQGLVSPAPSEAQGPASAASAQAAASPTTGPQQAGTAATDSQGARADLSTVNGILSKIDSALASGAPVSDDDLAQLESALKDLGGGAARYAPSAGK